MMLDPRLNVDEWSDQYWRLNNLYWITDKDGRETKFEMNWAQQQLWDEAWNCNIILKARQLGFTTLIDLWLLDSCIWYPNIRAGIIAHNLDDAEAIFRDKVKFAYDKLPEGIRNANPAQQDAAKLLRFKNNSSIRVGTSMRSGTLQYLHVSEFGKIAARDPAKAREIVTGAFNTVQAGQVIFVESTAEGQEGRFYDMCQTAIEQKRQHHHLTPLDFKFHFFPWWKHPDYVLDQNAELTQTEAEYFDTLEAQGIELNELQKSWYVAKWRTQNEDMKREYPSTPDESFEAAIEGAYYGAYMARADTEGRVGNVPFDPAVGVETRWDLGMGDATAIWWVQRVLNEIHAVKYYEASGEGLAHYARKLQEFQEETGCTYIRHLWPHDGKARILDERGRPRTEVMEGLGFNVEVVERGLVHEGIQAVRDELGRCWFDKVNCAEGLKALREYRKEWDDNRGAWKERPLHNWASHGADAWRTGAMADLPLKRKKPPQPAMHAPV